MLMNAVWISYDKDDPIPTSCDPYFVLGFTSVGTSPSLEGQMVGQDSAFVHALSPDAIDGGKHAGFWKMVWKYD